MSLQQLSEKRVDLYRIDPALLRIEDDDDRDMTPELAEADRQLTEQIKEKGVLEPLTVYLRDGVPYIVNGRRRLRCALKAREEGAEIRTVPVRTEEKGYNDADRIISSVIRNNGRPYGPLELSRKVVKLIGMGLSVGEIAKQLSFSRTYVDNLIAMSAAPQEVKNIISEGKIAPATAMKILKNEGEKKGTEVIKKAVAEQGAKGKGKVTEKHVKSTGSVAAPVKRDRKVPTLPGTGTVLVDKGEYASLLVKAALLGDAYAFIDWIIGPEYNAKELKKSAKALHGALHQAIYGEVVK